MQFRPFQGTRITRQGDKFAGAYSFSRLNQYIRQMSVKRVIPLAMIDYHKLPVAAQPVDISHSTCGRGEDIGADADAWRRWWDARKPATGP